MGTFVSEGGFKRSQIGIENETVVVVKFHCRDAYQAMGIYDVLEAGEHVNIEVDWTASRMRAVGERHPVDAFPVRWMKHNLEFSWKATMTMLWAAWLIWTFARG